MRSRRRTASRMATSLRMRMNCIWQKRSASSRAKSKDAQCLSSPITIVIPQVRCGAMMLEWRRFREEGSAMAIEVAILAAVLVVAVVALAIVVTRRSGDGRQLAAQEAEIAAARALAETARNEAIQRLADKVAAEPRLADLQRQLAVVTAELNDAAAGRDAALAAESTDLRELAVMRQQLGDFERLKEESLKSNQAAVFETAQQVSSKLLEDHKRENEEAKKTGEALVRQTTEQLFKQFHDVAQSLNQLEGRVTTDGQKIETVLRALSNPSGAGQFAEVLLANTLKSFGLEERRDFFLQHTTEDAQAGQRRRPHALLFFSRNKLLLFPL